jgi:imidazole glycerol-phosphate synthase subunit HisH
VSVPVGVIDLGTGNLYSVLRGFERAGGAPVVVRTAEEIRAAPRLVLPGVGSFADASRRLAGANLAPLLRERVAKGVPLFGICLGLQLLFEEGEEDGLSPGLGLMQGRVVKLKGGPGLAIPHMGWQRLQVRVPTALLPPDESPWMYFSHSYRVDAPRAIVAADVVHGESIPALVAKGRVFGLQPHPEKSGPAGSIILRSFLSLEGAGR